MLGFKRVIAASIALALIVAGLGGLLAFAYLNSFAQARDWVQHSRDVISNTQTLYYSVRDAESSERGYLATEDPSFLAPYQQSIGDISKQEAALLAMVGDNPDQAGRVKALNAAINRRLAITERVVALAKAGNTAGARAMVAGDEGRAAMKEIRDRDTDVHTLEDKLLKQRRGIALDQQQLVFALGLGVSLLALVALVVGVAILARSNRRLTLAMAETRAAEHEREATNALTRAIFANTPDYLIVLGVEADDRFVLIDVNPAFEKALNIKAELVRGRPINELLRSEMGERLTNHYRRVVAAGRPVTTRDEFPRLPGGPRIWESILAPVKNADGVTDRIIGAIRDITDRVKADERLRDSQRMEAVGQLTGGVAHDFNNLLQVIRGNLELLQSAVADNERAAARLKNAIHGADRAAQLTRQLLAFARRQPLAPQVVNLSRLVSDMADLLRRTLGEAIEVETVVAGGLWNTIADPAQVESALLNLSLNARDAMPGGGRLTVEITNAVLDEAYAREVGEVTPGQYVLLAVSDTGEGMDEATQARVFEPFFTTKSDGKGTGLGLSMVYGFVKQSNGHIQIYSEPGQGTTVKIYLPRSRQAAQVTVLQFEDAPKDGDRQVILVVEDEPAVRAAAVGMLEELGYRHIEAGDAEEALAMVETGQKIDLVFSDVVMPGKVKTRDFADRLKVLRPNLPLLFTSGYTENAIVHHGRLDEGVTLISKPYAKDELARKVAQMLAGNSPPP